MIVKDLFFAEQFKHLSKRQIRTSTCVQHNNKDEHYLVFLSYKTMLWKVKMINLKKTKQKKNLTFFRLKHLTVKTTYCPVETFGEIALATIWKWTYLTCQPNNINPSVTCLLDRDDVIYRLCFWQIEDRWTLQRDTQHNGLYVFIYIACVCVETFSTENDTKHK